MTDSEPLRLPPVGADAVTRLSEALADEPTPRMQAAADVATATRALVQELMSSSARPEDLAEAAALVRRATEVLTGRPHDRPYGYAESSMAGDERGFLDFSPLVGPANPIAPPLHLGVEGDTVVGRGTFGDAYEGPPGSVHGGFIAAAFDEVLGFTMSFTGLIGMTGRLVVHYRRPTPLHTELRFEGRVDRIDGRKLHTTASLHAGDVLTANAEALFIQVDVEVFRRLMEERRRPG